MDHHNWAGNYAFNSARLHIPDTVEQIQDLVSRASKLKVLGKRHSFNGVADTTGDHLSLDRFDQILELNAERRTVTIGGGITYGQLCRQLDQRGYALHNLASLPHISVAGACATATHGSGDRNRILATAVSAFEIVLADGSIKTFSREQDGEEFQGAVVSLGGLGVITKLTLDLQPTFAIRQHVYENLPFTQLIDNFERIMSSAYSVSLFTDWRGPAFNQVWLKCHAAETIPPDADPERFGATPASAPLHPIPNLSPEPCTEQGGIPGPWQERLTHFRIDQTPSVGDELQSEYLLPRHHASEALHAIHALSAHIAPLLQISEIRTVAVDTLWMSSCYLQESVAIHFTWMPDWPGVQNLLPQIEASLAPFHARPHWGKLFTLPPAQLQPLYPKRTDFQRLLNTYDPEGKFRNTFLNSILDLRSGPE